MNWLLLQNSLLVSGGATLLAVTFGFMAALFLAALERTGRNLLIGVAVAALALPPFLVTNCWLHYFGAAGAWRGWLPFNIFSFSGTVWILALLLWPVTTLAVWGAWQKLEASHFEAEPAMTGRPLVRWLLLPAARPALGLAALLTFVLALNNFGVPALLQVKVLPAEVWIQFNTTLNPGAALAQSWLLIALPVVALWWLRKREIAWPRLTGAASARVFRRQLGAGWVWFCGAFTGLLGALSVGLPLVQLVSQKRTWTEWPAAIEAGQSALGNSLWFAAVAATGVAAVGLLAGVAQQTGAARSRFRVSAFGLPALWLPFFAPGVLLGIGLIAAFNRPPFLAFYRGFGIVLVALVIRYLALGWSGVGHALRATDRDLADAARLDGATRWQLLRLVQWPQIAAPVAATWYVVYLLCLWDVETLVLIIPPGGETLALRVFNLLHYGYNAQVNALCLTLLGLAVAPLLVWTVVRGAWRIGTNRGSGNAQRTALFLRLAIVGAAVLLAGCAPQSTENEAPVESRFFSKVQIIGSRGVAPGQLNKPRSVAVDRQDNLYVADMTGRVQKFAPDGRYVLSWQLPQTTLGKPKGMTRDIDGNIIVIEPHYQRVNHFTPDGRLVAQWGVTGTNAGELKMPRAVAVDSHGEIFVSEYGLAERVQKFLPDRSAIGPERNADGLVRGNLAHPDTAVGVADENPRVPIPAQFRLGFGKSGTAPGDFNRPEGLCVDAQDRVYVADSCNHRIAVFSSDGRFLRSFGKAGSGKGELSYPYDICVDASGRAYVCEFGNSRIQVFDANGESLEILGGPGAAPGQFANPWGVALDSRGNLYVADSQNHRVQKFVRKPVAAPLR